MDITDVRACYQAVRSRDRRFDGVFYTGVRTTGIYCRPSCPARTPLPGNVTFHPTAAAAQAAGYRACKRCLPDATPGSPRWDVVADAAGRAMRLVDDGVVEREGVQGLARRLGYSPRHLTRILTAELGAGPLALARARRAQLARVLLESSSWRVTDVAYAAGFASVRQFNDTMREVYDATPTALRRGAGRTEVSGVARLELRVPVRAPFDGAALLAFLRAHLVPGVESAGEGWFARSLHLPHGPATIRVRLPGLTGRAGICQVPCVIRVSDLRDVPVAMERCRRLLDADCDPVAVDAVLGAAPPLAASVRDHPGLRVPGAVDGDELALRTVLGQQVSVAAGNRLAATLVNRCGPRLPEALQHDGLTRLFPTAADVATLDPVTLAMPGSRARALTTLAAALAAGDVALDRSADRAETRQRLQGLPGIGPWTAGYVVMRALSDPDVFLDSDVAVRRVLRGLGGPALDTERWRPWRSYALMHLWTSAREGAGRKDG